MRRLLVPLVLTVGLSTACGGISLQSLPKIGGVSGPTYKITATFTNVVNLPANAEVRVGAFSVGDVSSIAARNFQAVVTMKIKKSVKLPVGTTANVRFDTPLGEDYVLLQPPTSPSSASSYLADGAQISDTSTSPSVEDTFGALGALLNGGGINQLQTIITQTNAALDGNQTKIHALLGQLNSTVTALAANTPSIDGALNAMGALSQELNSGSQIITSGLAAIGPAAQTLAAQTNDLQQLFVQLNALSGAANTIITASAEGTVHTLQSLSPLLDQLSSVQQQLGPALSAITSLEQYTPRAIPGNYVQLSINATIGVPPVPRDAPPLQKVTLDPPDPTQSYSYQNRQSAAYILEGGLP